MKHITLVTRHGCRPGRTAAQALLVVSALTAAPAALAVATCTGTGATMNLALPTTVSVPRDADMPVGTLLTAWVAGPDRSRTFTCSAPTAYVRGVAANESGLSSAGLTVAGPPEINGAAVNVAASGVAGVGIAVAFRPFLNNWQAPARAGYPGWAYTSTDYSGVSNMPLGGQVWVALVKTATTISAGNIAANEVATVRPTQAGTPAQGTWTRDRYQIPAIRVQVGACQIPSNIKVSLGDARQSAFTTHGSTGPWVDFNIPVSGCPAYLGAIDYGLKPVDGFPADSGDRANGVINIQPGGATGMGIQLWDVAWDRYVPAYPSLAGVRNLAAGTPAFNIALRARMYQTGPATQPGDVNGQVQVMMVYR